VLEALRVAVVDAVSELLVEAVLDKVADDVLETVLVPVGSGVRVTEPVAEPVLVPVGTGVLVPVLVPVRVLVLAGVVELVVVVDSDAAADTLGKGVSVTDSGLDAVGGAEGDVEGDDDSVHPPASQKTPPTTGILVAEAMGVPVAVGENEGVTDADVLFVRVIVTKAVLEGVTDGETVPVKEDVPVEVTVGAGVPVLEAV